VKRTRYSRKFQRMAVERMRSSDNIGDLAKELGVGRLCLYKWQAKLDHLEPGEAAPRTNSHESSYRQQVHRLKCLAKSQGSTSEERRFWRDGIYDQIREVMPLQGNLSIERICELARVSRASFYRSFHQQQPVTRTRGRRDIADCGKSRESPS